MSLVLGLSMRIVRSMNSQCIFFSVNAFLSQSDWYLLSQNCGKMFYGELQVHSMSCYAENLCKAHEVIF